MKKYALCIPCSDDFALPTAVLIHSLETNFKLYDQCDVIVPYNNLSETAKDLIRKSEPNTKFVKPRDSSFYKHIPGTMYGKDNHDVYLSFEAFAQEGYEKTIYLDADMLCTGDFSDVMNYPHDVVWRNPNLGILIVDKKCVPHAYDALINVTLKTEKIRLNGGGDQKAVRALFGRESERVKFIGHDYNFQHWGGGGIGSNEHFLKHEDTVKIIHYSGRRKPWGNVWDGDPYDMNSIKYPYLLWHSRAVELWHEYYEHFKNKRLGSKLSPFEENEIKNGVLLKDTPGGVDGLK